MQRSSKIISGVSGLMSVLAVAGIALIASTGCSSHQSDGNKPALTDMPAAQQDTTMKASAQGYANYRKAHPSNGQAAPQGAPQ
jgi:hypothetical protein